MKTLSIRQPWAHLIVTGRKDIENRTWSTDHRGPLLIHAAQKPDPQWDEIARYFGLTLARDAVRYGGIVGKVQLVDVVQRSPSRWFTGPYGWVLTDAQQLPFRPLRGQLYLFDATDR